EESLDEARAIGRESLRKFGADRIDSAKIDEESRIGPDIVSGLADLGMMGLTIPEEFGGAGFDQTRYGRVMEELSAIDASTAVLLGGHLSIGAKGLLLYGTDEQRKRFLPELAAGGRIAAFALSEPNAGSDVHGMKTRAVRSA